MPTRDELKAAVCREIDNRSAEIISVARTILENPEPGFREVKTSQFIARKFGELGLAYQDGIAITGIKSVVNGGAMSGSIVYPVFRPISSRAVTSDGFAIATNPT